MAPPYDKAALEMLVEAAMTQLFTGPGGREGTWTSSLGVFGDFEIQLVRTTSHLTGGSQMWAALCAPATGRTITSREITNFDDAVLAVAVLAAQAKQLDPSSDAPAP